MAQKHVIVAKSCEVTVTRLGLCCVAPVVHIPSAYVSSTSGSPCLVLLEDFSAVLGVPAGGGGRGRSAGSCGLHCPLRPCICLYVQGIPAPWVWSPGRLPLCCHIYTCVRNRRVFSCAWNTWGVGVRSVAHHPSLELEGTSSTSQLDLNICVSA